MKLDHFSACPKVPSNIKERLMKLKDVNTRSNTSTMQYFKDSAKRLNLIDTPHGVFFDRTHSTRENVGSNMIRYSNGVHDHNHNSIEKSTIVETESSFNSQHNNCFHERKKRTFSAFTPLLPQINKRTRSSPIDNEEMIHVNSNTKGLRSIFDSNGSSVGRESKSSDDGQGSKHSDDDIFMSALYLTNVKAQNNIRENNTADVHDKKPNDAPLDFVSV